MFLFTFFNFFYYSHEPTQARTSPKKFWAGNASLRVDRMRGEILPSALSVVIVEEGQVGSCCLQLVTVPSSLQQCLLSQDRFRAR